MSSISTGRKRFIDEATRALSQLTSRPSCLSHVHSLFSYFANRVIGKTSTSILQFRNMCQGASVFDRVELRALSIGLIGKTTHESILLVPMPRSLVVGMVRSGCSLRYSADDPGWRWSHYRLRQVTPRLGRLCGMVTELLGKMVLPKRGLAALQRWRPGLPCCRYWQYRCKHFFGSPIPLFVCMA